MLGPENPAWQASSAKTLGNTPATLYLLVEDVDKVTTQAVNAGATLIQPPTDMFWGDRTSTVTDPDGNKWMLATHKAEPTPEEMDAAMKKQFAEMC
jgi:PhnB protein